MNKKSSQLYLIASGILTQPDLFIYRSNIAIMEEKKSFNDLVNGDKPVLVDFTATWCGPCKMMQPILQELANRIGDKASIIKIDVDKNQALAQSFQIQGVPTLMVFKHGKVQWRQSGVMNANQLEQVINQFSEEPVKS